MDHSLGTPESACVFVVALLNNNRLLTRDNLCVREEEVKDKTCAFVLCRVGVDSITTLFF